MKNRGKFVKDKYVKIVSFNKAVLWKDRAISLPPEIVKQFKPRNINYVTFIDKKKNEVWECDVNILRDNYEYKSVGQEPQYYFPIELFTVSEYKNEGDTVQSRLTPTTTTKKGRDTTERREDRSEVYQPEAGNNPTLFGENK